MAQKRKTTQYSNVLPDGTGNGRAAPRYREVLQYLIDAPAPMTQNEIIKAVGTGNITVNKLIAALIETGDVTKTLASRKGGPDHKVDVAAWVYQLRKPARAKYTKLIDKESKARAEAGKQLVAPLTVRENKTAAHAAVPAIAKKKVSKKKASKKKVTKKKSGRRGRLKTAS